MDEQALKYLVEDYAHETCDVCPDVLAGNPVINFSYSSGKYTATCSKEIAGSKLQNIPMKELILSHPSLAEVLHIPANICATRYENKWQVKVIDEGYEPTQDDYFVAKNFDEVVQQSYYLWRIVFTENELHYLSFDSGIKFIPVYDSLESAKNDMRMLARIYNTALCLPLAEICERARNDG